ncbi:MULTISPECIES: sensor histidine kinase [Alkalimonas]|uniref:Histidine kinase n=1 Tax=Alkalimonas mucilaginosa TaxID=3057676 RepID=A0ABU7JG39_9GAMM|nr:histidine kinase [Alkalimonas sp. MEB004]MEE2024658.1 histidine kinase [Alkalimonas sp. MEB004]
MNQADSFSHPLLLPAFCQNRGVLAVMVLSQAVAILLAFAPGAQGDVWLRLGVISLFVHWTTLLSITLLCYLRPRLVRFSPQLQGAVVLLTLLLFTLLISLLAWMFLANFGWRPPTGVAYFFWSNLFVAMIVGLLVIQFCLLHLERSVRIAAQSRAELDALQARIRPHFLFNSLNTAAELIHQDPSAAEQALLDLSALFRAAMQAGGQASLRDEIALARQYLSLEQWRLGARLRVDWQLGDAVPEVMMPVLTLQPLLENAIYHGIEPDKHGGRICIELVQSRQAVTLLIINSLPDTKRSAKGNGIALDNIRQRLALLYQDRAQLHCSSNDGHFRVKLVLPYSEPETRP